MKIAVNDANIFIDLFDIDLLQLLFELNIELHTTDLVINELEYEQKTPILEKAAEGKIIIKKFGEDELDEIRKLEKKRGAISIQDWSVYFYAKQMKVMILTGDNTLRKQAKENGFEVHGILWLLDQMVNQKILKQKQAVEKLEALMKINQRLPKKDCEERIKEWKNIK
jgi:predicted nucleic acid-binding protein